MKKIALFSVLALGFLALKPSDDFLILSIQKFNDYAKANPIVKVQLVLNQTKYSPGDTIFFKSFFLDSEHKPIRGKQILEAELRDENDILVNQISFRIVDGIAENQVAIPEQVEAGSYKLVSYSRWMKNFDEKYFFSKEISIVKRFQFESNEKLTKTPILSFFPEGGQMIAGLSNKILLKSNLPGEIKIKNRAGNIISSCQTDNYGIAITKFLPIQNEIYFAEIGTKTVRIGIPEQDGIALELQLSETNAQSINLKIAVTSNSIYKDKPIYLISTAKNKVTFSKVIQLTDQDSIKLTIPPKVIEDGLNQAFVLDAQGNIIAERVFWHNPSKIQVSFKSQPWAIQHRSKCTIELGLSDENGNALSGEGAVGITNAILFDETTTSFDNEIYLSDLPELNREINERKIGDEYWSKTANDFLMSYRWERIPWKSIISEQWQKSVHKFRYSLDVSGKAYYKGSNDALPDSTKLTIYLQDHLIGYDLYTGRNGFFELPSMYDFWGFDRLFYVAEKDGKEIKREIVLTIDAEKTAGTPAQLSKPNDKMDPYGDFKSKKEIIDKSFNYYAILKNQQKQINPNQEIEDELGGPDWQIKTEDYLVFSTMEELIHELLSFIKFRKKEENGSIRMVLIQGNQNKYANADPLFIIDGEMTKDISYFLSFKPKDILTIKIVRDNIKLSKLGTIAKNGVILVQTKKELFGKPKSQNLALVRGLNFYKPSFQKQYSKENNPRVPDFRATMYWNPELKFDESGKSSLSFFSSDDNGFFNIYFCGITNEGIPFSSRKQIEVKLE